MKDQLRLLEDAWLGIDVDESLLFNPMDFVMQDSDNDALLKRLSWLMMRPEYFSFVCKYVLNIQLSLVLRLDSLKFCLSIWIQFGKTLQCLEIFVPIIAVHEEMWTDVLCI